ncbi:hypothetical protein M0657_005931 [Pyricularia oryzae]|nr:hypothetical protein M9X92_008484 [Pyricularia oryzae]KAI7921739.1 hypothetical protein M0657_005931 [Pyricularia oryzae]
MTGKFHDYNRRTIRNHTTCHRNLVCHHPGGNKKVSNHTQVLSLIVFSLNFDQRVAPSETEHLPDIEPAYPAHIAEPVSFFCSLSH